MTLILSLIHFSSPLSLSLIGTHSVSLSSFENVSHLHDDALGSNVHFHRRRRISSDISQSFFFDYPSCCSISIIGVSSLSIVGIFSSCSCSCSCTSQKWCCFPWILICWDLCCRPWGDRFDSLKLRS